MNIDRIRLGISACLLGQRVRFDSGHKREPFLAESLGQFVDWVPVCPEVESGMGAPRAFSDHRGVRGNQGKKAGVRAM